MLLWSYVYISCLEFDKKGNLWIGIGYGISVFDGENWETFTSRNSPLPSNYIYSIAFEDDNTTWIATNSDGTAKPFEPLGGLVKYDGESWEVFTHENSGLPDVNNKVYSVVIDKSENVWIGMKDGLLARMDKKHVQRIVSSSIYILQNYPNPFNNSTTFEVDIYEKGTLQLQIFDVSGRKIIEQNIGHVNPSVYKRIWSGYSEDGSTIASGIYFYRFILTENNGVRDSQTRKMILLR